MFDVGWSELLVIAAVAVFVIGPKDIPKVMYTLGRVARRLQYVRFAISQQIDDVLKAGDIEELRKGVNFETKPLNSLSLQGEGRGEGDKNKPDGDKKVSKEVGNE